MEKYIPADLEIIKFETEDVIMVSGPKADKGADETPIKSPTDIDFYNQ